MKVTTNIRRVDLVYFNLMLLPRLRSTYVSIGVIALAVALFVLWQNGVDATVRNWKIVVMASLVGGIGGMFVGLVISLIFILFTSSQSNGILGAHEYEITSNGLFEKTDANEGLNKWAGIQEIRKVGPFLLFKISGYLFHVLPKRSFASEKEFQEFMELAMSTWRASKLQQNMNRE